MEQVAKGEGRMKHVAKGKGRMKHVAKGEGRIKHAAKGEGWRIGKDIKCQKCGSKVQKEVPYI